MTINLSLNSPVYDSSTPKFGASALSGGYGYAASAIPGSDPVTIEAWGKTANTGAVKVLCGQNAWGWIGIAANNTAVAHYGSGGSEVTIGTSVAIGDSAWHHFALVVQSSGGSFYVDGVLAGSSATSDTAAGVSHANDSPGFSVHTFQVGGYDWTGEIDEIAIWSSAKYASNFTPPSSPYTGSESNLVHLYHLDGNGTDSAGVSAATAYTLTGPSSGSVSVASSNFTVAANGSLSSSVVITPSDSSGGGTFTPTAVTLTSGSTSGTFTYTPASTGAKTISTTNSGSLSNPTSLTYTVSSGVAVAPNNAAIVYSPYGWSVGSSAAQTIQAGAYFKTLFSGASLTLNFTTTNNASPVSEIYYRIDGYESQSPWTKATVAATITVAMPGDTSAFPYHLLEVVVKSTSETINRWNSPSNTAVVFAGLTLAAGGVLLAPLTASKNILIYGDSITEGVRTVNQTAANDTDRNDVMMGWAFTLGRLLGAEVGVCGFGASGLVVTGSGSVPPLPTSYNLLYAGQSRSFSPTPDLIVLNEGTNDSGQSGSAVTTALTSVLNGLIAACPGTPIAVLRPFNGSQASALQAGIAACSNPGIVTYVDTTGFFNGAYGADSLNLHPSGPNNLGLIAPKVASALRPILYPGSARTFRPGFAF